MVTFRNSKVSRCLGGGSVKNIGLCLTLVVACGMVGCSQPAGPQTATKVMLEDEVKVKVEADGHSQVGAGQATPAATGQKP